MFVDLIGYLLLPECSSLAKMDKKQPSKKMQERKIALVHLSTKNQSLAMSSTLHYLTRIIIWKGLYNFKGAQKDVYGEYYKNNYDCHV